MNTIQPSSAANLIGTVTPQSSALNAEAVPGFVGILEQQILSNNPTAAPKSVSSTTEPAVLPDTEAETASIETDLNQQDLLSILLSLQTAPINSQTAIQTVAESKQSQTPVSQEPNPASSSQISQTSLLDTLSEPSKQLLSEPLLANSLSDSPMMQQNKLETQSQPSPALNQISQKDNADNLITASSELITQSTKTENSTLVASSANFSPNQTSSLSSGSPSNKQLIGAEESFLNAQPNQQTIETDPAKPLSGLTTEANVLTQTNKTITNQTAIQDISFQITAAARQIDSSIEQYNQLAINPQQINLATKTASESMATLQAAQNPIINSGSNSHTPDQTGLPLPESDPQINSSALLTESASELTKHATENESKTDIIASKAAEISVTDTNQSAAMSLMAASNAKTNLPAVDFATSTSQTAPSFPIETHISHPDWHKSVGDRLIWLVNNQQQTASLSLNPEHLGPIQIQVQIDNQQANVQFIANQAEVRQALQNAMPLLNSLFEQSGIQLGQSFVGTSDPGSQGQGFNQSKRANKPAETLDNDQNLFSISVAENQGSNLINVSV